MLDDDPLKLSGSIYSSHVILKIAGTLAAAV